MHLRTLVLTSAAVALTVSHAVAYAQTPIYSLVTTIKCRPGKTAECEDYLSKNLHKSMQLRVERGVIDGFILTRLVDPQAAEAGFTHTYLISSSKPIPAESSPEYRKAGADATGMTEEENLAKQREVRDIVSRYRTRTVSTAGTPVEKGDFVRTSFLKTPHGKRTELASSMKLRQGMMEQSAKKGRLRGWTFREALYRGEADPFDALESLIYKDAEAVMSPAPPVEQLRESFEKGNPGKNYEAHIAQRRELNRVQTIRTSKVIDVIRK